jgi:hypothetical protein
MDSSLLKSPQGDTSSKRVAGIVLVALGIGAGLVGAWRQNSLLVEYAKYVIGLGSGLLAVGVVEHLVP